METHGLAGKMIAKMPKIARDCESPVRGIPSYARATRLCKLHVSGRCDMNRRKRTAFWCMTMLAVVSLSTVAQAQTNPFTKAQVGDRIRKVEDGVDQFRNYLDNRGQDAKNRADSAKNSGATTRRQSSNSGNTDARTNQAKQTKDDLENAMDDLNRTTNRLRRKFDPTSNYLETKAQMEQVMDSARRVNQVMTKGNYGSQAEKYWAALRANINDLARCYNLTPMGA
jgi:hypothetical protein